MLNEPIAIALMEIIGGVEAIEYHYGCRNMSAAIYCFKAQDDLIDCPESRIGNEQHDVGLKNFDEADRIAIRRER